MLNSTTLLVETAMVVGPTTTTIKASTEIVKDEEGNEYAAINKKKSIAGTLISTSITGSTYIGQEMSYEHTINKYRTTAAYVESLSTEELENALIAINELDAPQMQEEVSKKPKVLM